MRQRFISIERATGREAGHAPFQVIGKRRDAVLAMDREFNEREFRVKTWKFKPYKRGA